jgi:hypothetical protein
MHVYTPIQNIGTLFRTQDLDLRNQRTINDHGPAGLDLKLGDIEAGLLLKFTTYAQIEINFAVDDVVRIRRTTGKIDFPSIESMRTHGAKQKRAISCQDCRCAETITYSSGRSTPMPLGGKACIVGFQIFAAENAMLNDLMVQQQHATVPNRRLLPA